MKTLPVKSISRVVLVGLAASAAIVPLSSQAEGDAQWREQVHVSADLRIQARPSVQAAPKTRGELPWRYQVAQPSGLFIAPLAADSRVTVGRDSLWREQVDGGPSSNRPTVVTGK